MKRKKFLQLIAGGTAAITVAPAIALAQTKKEEKLSYEPASQVISTPSEDGYKIEWWVSLKGPQGKLLEYYPDLKKVEDKYCGDNSFNSWEWKKAHGLDQNIPIWVSRRIIPNQNSDLGTWIKEPTK